MLLALLRPSPLATLVFELRRPENGGYAHLGWPVYRRLVFMTRARRWTVLLLYALSITLSTFLLYLSLFHCQLHIFGQCTKSEGRSRQKSFSEYLATVVACTLTACSTCWLLANLRRIENSWLSNYNFLVC